MGPKSLEMGCENPGSWEARDGFWDARDGALGTHRRAKEIQTRGYVNPEMGSWEHKAGPQEPRDGVLVTR